MYYELSVAFVPSYIGGIFGLENVFVVFLISIFRSGRISSVYIVGGLLWVVGHTFSKLVNFECFGMLECVGVLECWCAVVLECVGVLEC